MIKKSYLRACVAILSGVFLSACLGEKVSSAFDLFGTGWLSELAIRAEPDMNFIKDQDNPEDSGANASTLDVVFIYDEKALEALKNLSGVAYCKAKDQLTRDHRGSLQIFSYEVLPNDWKDNIKIEPKGTNVVAILVFANYFAPGDHRSKIDTGVSQAEIHMKRESFEVIDRSEQEESNS